MPVSYHIDTAKQRLVLQATGVLTGAEVLEARLKVSRDVHFSQTLDVLFDMSDVTEEHISADEVREMATLTVFRAGVRRAYIAPQPVLFGITRMFQSQLGDRGDDIRIFKTRAEGERWLDGA